MFRQLKDSVASILEIIGKVLIFPIKMIFYPFEAIAKSFRSSGNSYGDYGSYGESTKPKGIVGQIGHSIRKIGGFILMLPVRLLQAPFLFLKAVMAEGKTELLFVLPAILMIGFFGFVFYQVFGNSRTIENRYRKGAQAAVESGDAKLAKTYYSRLVAEQQLSDRDRLQWALILAETGEPDRAMQIIDELAPENRPGYSPAHKFKAVAMVTQLQKNPDPNKLPKLRHHLQNIDEQSVELKQMKAAYFTAVGDIDKALGFLRSAAEQEPKLWVAYVNLCDSQIQQFGPEDVSQKKERLIARRNEALQQAKTFFQEELDKKDGLDTQNRILLANVTVRLAKLNPSDTKRQQQLAEAESLLRDGLKKQPDQMLRRAAADFLAMKYDDLEKARPFSEKFALLKSALALDPDYVVVYQRLISLYQELAQQNQKDAPLSDEIKETLLAEVTGDTPSAMAHFALSNVYWLEDEKEKAQWHVEQAFDLAPKFSIVVNNLAWMLAHQKEPDLDRALELALSAVEQTPNDARILDTLATIYLLRSEFEDAIPLFQKALPKSDVKREIHEKLTNCYEKIGRQDLADLHRKRAIQLAGQGAQAMD